MHADMEIRTSKIVRRYCFFAMLNGRCRRTFDGIHYMTHGFSFLVERIHNFIGGRVNSRILRFDLTKLLSCEIVNDAHYTYNQSDNLERTGQRQVTWPTEWHEEGIGNGQSDFERFISYDFGYTAWNSNKCTCIFSFGINILNYIS